mmetsp:Transcript_71721/g.164357  ORF Transcript_71721/g.164357 Transcript_71721/m.164357 type:complete len:242 (+) Transcript_71721:2366-3091(+)
MSNPLLNYFCALDPTRDLTSAWMMRSTSLLMCSRSSSTAFRPTTMRSMSLTVFLVSVLSWREIASAMSCSRMKVRRGCIASDLSSTPISRATSAVSAAERDSGMRSGPTTVPFSTTPPCWVRLRSSRSSGVGVHSPVSTSHTSIISLSSTSPERTSAGTTPSTVSTCTVPSASTSRHSSGPDIMPDDIPVSHRHTSAPVSVTNALIPRSCGVCPTTMRLAFILLSTSSSSSPEDLLGFGTE